MTPQQTLKTQAIAEIAEMQPCDNWIPTFHPLAGLEKACAIHKNCYPRAFPPPWLTSLDTIIPVVRQEFYKDCAFGNAFINALFEINECPEASVDLTDVYNTSAQITLALMLSTPEQIVDALLKASGKWTKEME